MWKLKVNKYLKRQNVLPTLSFKRIKYQILLCLLREGVIRIVKAFKMPIRGSDQLEQFANANPVCFKDALFMFLIAFVRSWWLLVSKHGVC